MRDNVKILAVSRDPSIRDFIVDVLEFSVNREVLCAQNEGEALEHLDTYGQIDIIFCDEVLERMSGRDLLVAIKKHQPRCIGILIAAPLDDAHAVAPEVVDAYLEKPFDIQALFNIVQRYVVDG